MKKKMAVEFNGFVKFVSFNQNRKKLLFFFLNNRRVVVEEFLEKAKLFFDVKRISFGIIRS